MKQGVKFLDYDRNQGIGGSDAHDIINLNWQSLWRKKLGLDNQDDLSWVLPVQIGVVTEEFNKNYLGHILSEETGVPVEVSDYPESYQIKDDIFFAHYDGYIEKQKALIECKHTNHFNKMSKVWERYFPQIQHYLYVSGLNKCYLSVIFGNMRYEYTLVTRNHEYLEEYVRRAKMFWEYVKTKKQPPEEVKL